MSLRLYADGHIVQKEGFLGGKPHIAGTRMSVHQIAILHERNDWSIDDIVREHDLTPAQIHAALSYYYDHRTEIDVSIAADDAFTQQNATHIRNIINQKGD